MVSFRKYDTNVKPFPDDEQVTEQDIEFILRAYAIAKNAIDHGNHPFSGLLVHEGEVLLEVENEAVTTSDVTKHAETLLISRATSKFDTKVLSESTLYASTEPCVMCCGAIHWAGIRKIVYGVQSSQMMESMGDVYNGIPCREVFERLNPAVIVTGPVSERVGLQMHWDFWPKFYSDQNK